MEHVLTILRSILAANVTVTKDDNTTIANVKFITDWYTDDVMQTVDAIVTVGLLDMPVIGSGIGDPNQDYTPIVLVNVWTATKYDTAGNQIITSDFIRWKLCQAIDHAVKLNAKQPNYGTPSQPSHIQDMHVRDVKDLDDPQHTPYPLNRTEFQVVVFFQAPDLTEYA